MTIEYQCPVCRETTQLPDEQEGQLSVCRRCRLKFIAPAPRPSTVVLNESPVAEILPPTPPAPTNPFSLPSSAPPPPPESNPFAVSYSDDNHRAIPPEEAQSKAYINPGENPFRNPVPGSPPMPPPPPEAKPIASPRPASPFAIPDSGQLIGGVSPDPFAGALEIAGSPGDSGSPPFAAPVDPFPPPPPADDPFPPPPPAGFPPPPELARPVAAPDNPFAAPVPETAPKPSASGVTRNPAASGVGSAAARSPHGSGVGSGVARSPQASGPGRDPQASGAARDPQASGAVRDPRASGFDPSQRPARYYLAVVDGAELQSFQFFQGSSYIIGRDGAADIKILSKSVSRQHARIETDGPQPVLFDLGSANGTVVNGTKVKQLALRDGDLVKFGEVILRFQTD